MLSAQISWGFKILVQLGVRMQQISPSLRGLFSKNSQFLIFLGLLIFKGISSIKLKWIFGITMLFEHPNFPCLICLCR